MHAHEGNTPKQYFINVYLWNPKVYLVPYMIIYDGALLQKQLTATSR